MLCIYLLIIKGYIEAKDANKYLIFYSRGENKKLLKEYNYVFNGIRDKVEEVCGDECDYEKNYIKIKFNSDDNLPLNKPLKFNITTITIRSFLKKMVNFIRKFF